MTKRLLVVIGDLPETLEWLFEDFGDHPVTTKRLLVVIGDLPETLEWLLVVTRLGSVMTKRLLVVTVCLQEVFKCLSAVALRSWIPGWSYRLERCKARIAERGPPR